MNVRVFFLLLIFFPVSQVRAGECFCLTNKEDFFRHSCEMQQQGSRKVAQCRDDNGQPYKIEDLSCWDRIPDGQGRCKPCRQKISIRFGGRVIRGDHNQQLGYGD